jgi:GNAT superfamily N-acetyltransferase
MIRSLTDAHFEAIRSIINDGARAYAGVIPPDRLHDPYMSADELRYELAAGVFFSGYDDGGELAGVMGVQNVKDVTLIRHAYVRTDWQGRGIGSALLRHLDALTELPVLLGTWADASWAIRFYEKHGFRRVSPLEKNRLLATYWTIPERQIETSVVLADERAVSCGVVASR